MLESIAANLVTNTLVFLWKKNKGNFSGSKSDFERELTKVIYESLEVYEKTVSQSVKGKIPFYRSQVFMDELLAFRFSKPFEIEEVKNAIENDPRIIPPSQEELISFFEILDINLKKSEQLRILFVENNYKEEVFKISELLKSQSKNILKSLDDVKSVVTKTQKLIIARTNEQQLLNAEISHEDIIQELKAGSSALLSWQNKLGRTDINIEREETRKLLNWLFESLGNDAKGVAVLHGIPGIGKTVIMRDVCEQLQDKNIPTLGIRTDLYQAEGFDSLKSSLNLSQSIINTIKYLTRNHELVVILLDQLDALSQSFSGNPLFLDTYNQLIWRLSEMKNVRVIISSRTYDLNSDPTLKEYTKSSSFEVLPLREEQVKGYLNKYNICSSKLSQDFLQILRVPNHLNVFFRIYHGGKNLDQLKTLSDLYRVLWEQFLEKIQKNKEEEKITMLVSELTAKMNLEQRLTVPISDHIFYRKKGIRKKLVSGGILIEKDEKVQFFHQTFYEYFFARQFVLSNSNLKGFILENHQGLSCRAAVKLILQFYRSSNLEEYIKCLRELIFDNKIRFHFKYLALSILADQANPFKKEEQFLVSDILSHPRFGVLFFKQKKSKNWNLFFLEAGIGQALIFPKEKAINTFEIQIPDEFGRGEIGNSRRHLLPILTNLISSEPRPVLEFLKSVPEFEEKSDYVSKALYFLEDWSFQQAIELYEKYDFAIKKESSMFFRILNNATEYQYDWVVKELYHFLVDEKEFKEKYSQDRGYPFNTNNNIEKLFEKNKKQTFHFLIETLLTTLANGEESSFDLQTYFKSSYLISLDDFRSDGTLNTVYRLIKQEVVKYSKEEPEEFRRIFQKYHQTKWISIIQLMLFGILENPLLYVNETMSLIEFIHKKKGFEKPRWNNTQYYLRNILSENIVEFTSDQWEKLKEILYSFPNDGQVQIREVSGKKVIKNFIDYDLMLYLQSLPESFLKEDLPVWKKFQELERRYEKLKDKLVNQGGIMRGVPPPLPSSAYEKMSLENWKKSFRKYDKNFKRDFRDNRGDSYQHKSQFKSCVEESPEKFLPLIEELINDESYDSMYVLEGIEGLRDSKVESSIFLEHFLKALSRKKDDPQELIRYVYLIRFFNTREPLDSRLFDWLKNIILSENLPTSISSQFSEPLTKEFTSKLKEGVIGEWMYLQRLKRTETGIFEVIDRAIDLNDKSFRAKVIERISFVRHLNRSKCLTLFKKLIKNKEEEVLKNSLYGFNDFIWDDFEGLLPFIKEIYQKVEFQEKIAQILAVQWIEGKDAAWPILKEIFDTNDKAILKIPEVAIFKTNEKPFEYCERSEILFRMFLNHPSEEVAKAYDIALFNLEQQDFPNVKHLLIEYKKSFAAKKIPSFFFRYLHKCVSRYPKEVIELMDFWENYDNPDIFSEGYDRGEPIQILISVYRHLSKGLFLDEVRLNKVLDMIDKMLENPNLMGTSLETIEKFEIG